MVHFEGTDKYFWSNNFAVVMCFFLLCDNQHLVCANNVAVESVYDVGSLLGGQCFGLHKILCSIYVLSS